MIELLALKKQFGNVSALDDVNLHVAPGEIFGVIGPSGAGKSTLIRTVNLLERPDSGKVFVNKQDLTTLSYNKLREARRNIGMIFQHFNLLSSRTVSENIALPLRLANIPNNTINKKITPLLELTGLVDKQHMYPSQLSGGQKQRVAIARALVNEPKILLSDEATSALDPQTTHDILQLLKNINEELGLTILLITHEMDVVKEICHHLAIMEQGKVIEQAAVIDFFANPQTDCAKSFICSDLTSHLPESISGRLASERSNGDNLLLRLSFVGNVAQEPLISHLMQQLNINLNILQANIESIRDQMMGTMVVEASGDDDKITQGIQYLSNKGVHVEQVGYVTHD